MAADPTTSSQRPSLTGRPPLDEIRHLLEIRTPVYRELADLALGTRKASRRRNWRRRLSSGYGRAEA